MKPVSSSLLPFSILLSLTAGFNLDCDHTRVDGRKFDLSKLAGRHDVWVKDVSRPPAIHNTTYTINLCAPLQKLKGVKDADQCTSGTRVCGVDRSWNPIDDPDKEHVTVESVIPIAGNIDSTGSSLDAKVERLKAQDPDADGLLIELNGGMYGKVKQKAVIEMQCDRSRTGNDDEEEQRKRDEGDEEDETSQGDLTFKSYRLEEGKPDIMVLRLEWKTMYACEDYANGGGGSQKSGWGFFTWFILLAFLGISAYLIFGSWLNYNRYGARGWDLLPHGDTIRDIPYIVKDFSRKVAETVGGGGSRGGYSAV